MAGAGETPVVVTIGPGEGDRQSIHSVRTLPSILQGLVVLSRPRQWIKNLLVFAAPGAAGVLVHRYVLWHSAAAFAIFCIAASGAYFFNDAIDAKADRLHPVKRFRPVASGAVSFALAIVVGGAMLVSAVGLGALLAGRDLAVVMALYAIINVGYSLGLKNEAIVDLALVSAGFVLRAIAGGVATGVALSHWFIIVTTFGSLLVVTGKRSGEKAVLSGSPVDRGSVRQTLELYSPEFLRSVRTLSAAITMTAYCLWAFGSASPPGAGHRPIWFELTIVPFGVALLHIVQLLDSGRGEAPRGAGRGRPPSPDLRHVLDIPLRDRDLRVTNPHLTFRSGHSVVMMAVDR